VRSQGAAPRRITVAPENATSLNPTLSGDGRRVVFESTASLLAEAGEQRFRAYTADISSDPPKFSPLAASRAPAAAVSQDGSTVAFASAEDLTGENADRNSEIFLSADGHIVQLTHTTPSDPSSRARDGNFQPSLSDDARLVAFSSDRDLTGENPDGNSELFIYESDARRFTQLTNTSGPAGARDAKLSGDGSTVAFVRDNSPAGASAPQLDLVLCRLSTKSFLILRENVARLALSPARSVSDDGTRVVYAAETAANASQVFLYDGRNGETRQLTRLSSRVSDVPLNPTISGDGSRVAFATRRSVVGNSDGGVELYLYDLPTSQLSRVTDAPATATAEVVASLDDAGSLVAFNFPRVLAISVSSEEFANDSEIFIATLAARAPFSSDLKFRHGAIPNRDLAAGQSLAPGQIAIARGANLALATAQSQRLADGAFPRSFKNSSVTVNGRAAQILFVSPAQVNFQIPDETETGAAEIVVTNHDGYESRAAAQISRAAPGVFTERGDGTGAAIALDSATLTRAPFDPHDGANGSRLITLFATGVRHAETLSATMAGRELPVASVIPSPDLPGLDEIRVRLPRALAGAGVAPLSIKADGRTSNEASVELSGARRAARVALTPGGATLGVGRSLRFVATVFDEGGEEIVGAHVDFASDDAVVAAIDADGVARALREGDARVRVSAGEASAEATLRVRALSLVINEVLADPPDGAVGDANRDGLRSASQDEFVEIVNASEIDFDLGGYRVATRDAAGGEIIRHAFPHGFVLAPGAAAVVFGGANAATFNPLDPAFAGARVVTSSTGGLSLLNGGATVALLDPAGAVVEEMTYGGSSNLEGDRNQSLTRAPDVSGDFALHQTLAGVSSRLFSPGTKVDGTPFQNSVPVARVEVEPASCDVQVGATCRFTARAFDGAGRELRGVLFGWQAGDESVATLDRDGAARALRLGTTEITAGARGTRSAPSRLSVVPPPRRIFRVEVAPGSASLNRGGAVRFTARALDQNDRVVPDATFVWSSDETAVATVDANGSARGAGVGVANLTATTEDGAGGTVSANAALEVKLPILISEVLADVPPDDPATAAVEGDANRDGVRNSGDDEFVELFNPSDSAVDLSGARVSDATADRYTFPAGTTLEAGRSLVLFGGGSPPTDDPAFGASLVRVASSLSLNDGGDTVALKLKVASREITLASLTYGAQEPIHAPTDQSLTRERDAGDGLGAGFVAHLSASNAAARAFSPGTLPDGAPFGSPPITRIEITPTTAQLDIGASQLFTARAFAGGGAGEVEVANVSFAWGVSVPANASFAPASGAATNVTARAAGGVTVRARAGSQQASAALTVNPPPPVLTRVELSPTTATIFVGGEQQFTARAFDQFDQPFRGAAFGFISDDANVARVESMTNNEDGSAVATVSGRAAGTAHVAATARAGSTLVAGGAATLNVNPPPPALASVVVAPSSATVAAGEAQQFTARGFDQDGREMGGLAFTWASSDQSVAAIDRGGRATAIRAGATRITAASGGVTSAPAALNVTAPPVAAAGQVVINEALVSFSSSATQARADFVELYNTTGQTLDISGIVVSFRASGNTSAVSTATLPGAVTSRTTLIAPHAYFLVANGATTFGIAADYDASASGFDLNNSSGAIKIELGGIKLDGLRYQQSGSAVPPAAFDNFGEGTIFTFAGGAPNDLIRSPNATDTDNNAADFRRNGTTASISPKAANP
jgi:uncharacterized protein (TIGR03437 family)